MSRSRNVLVAAVARFAARLRFPVLFALTAALLVVDLLVPDAIPMADELLLALGTVLLASLRRRRPSESETENGDVP